MNSKRGRPKSELQKWAADLIDAAGIEGCDRTKANFSHVAYLQFIVRRAGDEAHRTVFGVASMLDGGTYPRGFKGAAVEIVRYLLASGDSKENVVQILVSALERRVPWRDIAAAFRQWRLGDRKRENGWPLAWAMYRASLEYRKNFPKIERAEVEEALRWLRGLFEDENETIL